MGAKLTKTYENLVDPRQQVSVDKIIAGYVPPKPTALTPNPNPAQVLPTIASITPPVITPSPTIPDVPTTTITDTTKPERLTDTTYMILFGVSFLMLVLLLTFIYLMLM